MKLKIINNKGILHPPAKEGDAGFDIVAVSPPRIIGSIYQGLHYTAISHIEYDTEIQIEPSVLNDSYEFYTLVFPRSSIINTNLSLSNSIGVIDSGYRGNIKICFKYHIQPEDMKIISGKSIRGKNASGIIASINPQRIYQEGDKIAQLIPTKHCNISLEKVDHLSSTDRGSGGFGSTGK